MEIKDWFLSQEKFEIKKISKGILKTSPIPKDISKYYDSKEYISHHKENNSFNTIIYKIFQYFNLKYKKYIIDTEIKTGNNLLDYGCGTGEFIKLMKKTYKVKGLEINKIARNSAIKKIGVKNIYKNISEIEDYSLDIITLWHVFEHIENQEKFLQQIEKKIKSKGKLIIAVPNYKSYDAQYYKEYWAGYDVPRHIYHFSKEGIISIFENNKWKLLKIKPLLLDAFYISIISERYMKKNLPWIKGILRGIISNKKAFKTGEFSSLIYILEKK